MKSARNLLRMTPNQINAKALELGLEPPICHTTQIESYAVDDDGHHDVHLSRPVESIDSARMLAFIKMMHEIEES